MQRGPPASITTKFRHRSEGLRIIRLKVGEAGKQTDRKKASSAEQSLSV